MPERKGVRRVDSTDVQGADSWVDIRRLKGKEIRKVITEAGENAEPAVQYQRALTLYGDHVVGWNWVDDSGKALPQPSEDSEVLGELYDSEITFLGEALVAAAADQKN